MPFDSNVEDTIDGIYLLTRLTTDGTWGTYEISNLNIADSNSGVRLINDGSSYNIFPNGPTPPNQPDTDYIGFQFSQWTVELQFMLHTTDMGFSFHIEQRRDLAAFLGEVICAMSADNRVGQKKLHLSLDTRIAGYSSSAPTPSSFPLQSNTWHHMAISDNGSQHKFYFDGELVWSTGYNLFCQDKIVLNPIDGDVSIREFAFYNTNTYPDGNFTITNTQERWNASML